MVMLDYDMIDSRRGAQGKKEEGVWLLMRNSGVSAM